jgi:hypothetical protein
LQVAALVWLPPAHDPCPQTVPAGQSLHAPAEHKPFAPQVDAWVAAQTPRGSAVPFVASPHTPFAPPVSAAEQA